MPVTTTYPGVYIEEIPSGICSISGFAASDTAFIGYNRRCASDTAVKKNRARIMAIRIEYIQKVVVSEELKFSFPQSIDVEAYDRIDPLIPRKDKQVSIIVGCKAVEPPPNP
jgi:hypothetical protein